ncbi:SgcJ/EcaC family oxidoreductase [Marivita sp. XM-24bin2]|uniref:SgcJ/EcaC family oxidoreductase n=1 Tax=unclassified Marivita TaxID=2632480 RepID=UPI0025BF2626|nr:SgcJ/EcaC family oxidoreductase [Marivita sp. XM-24bin2]
MEWRPDAVLTVSTPEHFPKAFADAWHSRDGHRIGALFAEDADFVNVTGLWWRNRAAISKAHDYALKSFFKDTTLKPGVTSTRHLGTNHAIVHCRFTLKGQTAPDGSIAGDRQTILIFVLQRADEGWLAVAAQNTDVVPGKETHLNTGELTSVDYRDT